MSREYGQNVRVNQTVEVSPSYDLWMMGARYGVVKEINGRLAKVEMHHPEVKGLKVFPIADLKPEFPT